MFSGGGGVEALLKDSIDFVHAVEYDPAIADVYRRNHGDHIQVADVCDVDYSTWGALDYLHASPVCKNASQAKTDGEESETDIKTALAVVRCLEATQPRVFTLENVGGYARFEAYRRICRALDSLGYMWHAEVLNAADYGVPQTRRRLILRAVRDSLLPGLPAPLPWVGWYAAIEDLILSLPPSQFAKWQIERLPEEVSGDILMMTGNTSFSYQAKPGVGVCSRHEPANSVYATPSSPRAFIVSNAGNNHGDADPLTVRYGEEPCHSVTTQANGRTRAWLVDQQNGGRGSTVRAGNQPAFTLTQYSTKHPTPRAWLSHGRVVRMTPRALARFQSIPDSFWLPEKASLACTVIGNSCPSLLMREIVTPLL